ncbi:hypothetical protein DYB28_003420 [Aphanomyces astaci]|uniref:Uncharacterized protein n=1 Tax=Aphanomyces astaci TaxID=112090 RepID=A0A9X8E8W6_APHAT|nr:hypothetical protein DYB28_003420 [Aphanomyces astaci]
MMYLSIPHVDYVNTGNSPLHIARLEGHEGIAAMLVEHGANVHATNKAKQSCLDIAPRAFRLRVLAAPC